MKVLSLLQPGVLAGSAGSSLLAAGSHSQPAPPSPHAAQRPPREYPSPLPSPLPSLRCRGAGHLDDPVLLSAAVLAGSFYNVTGYSIVIGLSAGMETLCGQASTRAGGMKGGERAGERKDGLGGGHALAVGLGQVAQLQDWARSVS